MAGLTASDIIFSDQANHKFSETLGDLRRSNLSITNRLQSIVKDAAFVESVKASWQLPLIANERCGGWYIDPASKDGSAYFKSTDGHTGVWKFSTRRLNLNLLSVIGDHDGQVFHSENVNKAKTEIGILLLTLLEGGKVNTSDDDEMSSLLTLAEMPDALSKTIPIWCAVINRALFPEKKDCHDLCTPPEVVSSSENSQISSLLDTFLDSFLELEIDLPELRKKITKPLKPLWITPETDFSAGPFLFADYHTIICCTASKRTPPNEQSENDYVQGSGDDTENWAHGLTSTLFWENRELLLATAEVDLPDTIARLAKNSLIPPKLDALKAIAPTSLVFLTDLSTSALRPAKSLEIGIRLKEEISAVSTWQASPTQLDIGLGPHKLGSKNMRTSLPYIVAFIERNFAHAESEGARCEGIVVSCLTGKDHSVGVALAILCLFFDDQGHILKGEIRNSISKLLIRKRLSWLTMNLPNVNPSRATLRSVNSYLMERPA